MRDIRPTTFLGGCSNLAKTSRRRNKNIRKLCATEPSYYFAGFFELYAKLPFENSKIKANWRKL
jgi:hypothetical protein